jgi:cytochrome c peroxidase
MRLIALLVFVSSLAIVSQVSQHTPAAPVETGRGYKSPVDIAVLPDGRRAITANQASDSASLIDFESGKILAEVACGRKPAGIACSRDGTRVAVSNCWSGTVSLFAVEDQGLRAIGQVPVGDQPRGLVFGADGSSLFVALAGAGEVVEFSWNDQKLIRTFSAPGEPRRLTLSNDGRFLAAASGRSCEVRCWELSTGTLKWQRKIGEAFNLHGLSFSRDGSELVAAHIHDRQRSIGQTNIAEGWAIDNRLSRLTLEPNPQTEYWQIGLDMRGKAVGDPCAVAFSANQRWLTIAAGGTHELLIFQRSAIPWNGGDPGDTLDSSLSLEDGKLRRIPLGGRPAAIEFAGASERVVVANSLLDSVQLVDANSGKLVRQISLGGATTQDLARRGEVIFYDAVRSHHQWFSCQSCHPDGHTCGRSFDTLNDDSYGNPKLTPTLRAVAHTAPYTWHGWQASLESAVEKSLTDTLFGPKPTSEDVRALTAFLGTLEHPPTPSRRVNAELAQARERGRVLFAGKAGCASCHKGDYFTSSGTYDIGLEADGSSYEHWNPPSLRGVKDRGPYLHDGRAESLQDVLQLYHTPKKLGKAELAPDELADLIQFLKSI